MKHGCDLLNDAVYFCKQKKWIKKDDIVLLALSGGADSVFLFYVLLELKKSIPFDLHTIHINHLLRGNESDGDELFVAQLTKNHKVESSLYKIDVAKVAEKSGQSIEMAARDVRYDLFYKESAKIGASVIATAHNADDRVETALMRFISGSSVSGISGLKGIRQHKNKKIIRPIINFFKSDILEYLGKNNIPFRFDSSNNDNVYQRNKIRNLLIPFIEKDFNPSFKRSLLTTINLFEQQASYLKEVSGNFFNEALITRDRFFVFDKIKLVALHQCLISQILIDSLYAVHGADIRIASYHIKNLVEQIKLTSSRTYVFPENIIAVVDRHYLMIMDKNLYGEFIRKHEFLEKIKPNRAFSLNLSCGFSIDVTVSGVLEQQNEKFKNNENDWDKLIAGKEIIFSICVPFEEGLIMRTRTEGDRICFKYGTKKLKKYYIDNHIPFIFRNLLPVISIHDRIAWAPKMRLKDLPEDTVFGKFLSIQIKMKLN